MHTPGQWEVTPGGYEVRTVTGKAIALIAERDKERFPNARLIAAAPALLEACKAAMASLAADEEVMIDWDANGYDAQILAQLRAAIAEAEGTTVSLPSAD